MFSREKKVVRGEEWDQIEESIKKENYSATMVLLNKLLFRQPNNVEALMQRADIRRVLKNFNGELSDYNQVIAIQPNNITALVARGKFNMSSFNGNLKDAIIDFNQALESDPNNPTILKLRSEARNKSGDYKGALEDLNMAIKLDPIDDTSLAMRGNLKMQMKDFKGASEDFEIAYQIAPNDYYLNCTKLAQHEVGGIPLTQGKDSWHTSIDDSCNAIDLNVISEKPLASKSTVVKVIPFALIEIGQKIGEGGFGEVFVAKLQKISVAVKILKVSREVEQDLLNEVKFLARLRHKNIIEFQGISSRPESNDIVIVMEYMKNGSLDSLIQTKKLKRQSLLTLDVIRIALDVAKGLHYLHHQTPTVIHRDLKSANVLLYQDKLTRAKIADFGTARFLNQNSAASTILGTIGAIAPEILADERYDEKVDIFSFGVLVYEMITTAKLGILEEKFRLKRIDENVTDPNFNRLIRGCCSSDPMERPTINECITQLKAMKQISK